MSQVLVLVMMVSAVFCIPSPQSGHSGSLFPIIPYEFAFEISDPLTNNYQSRAEVKLPNGDVLGSWSLLLPDGNIQTVTYNVTGIQGFQYSVVLTPTNRLSATNN
ncbi:cuticle protein 21-like [Macrobrachium rosenbergii]|uniref:cuticle protein 21-like n=1 Tax=Macrobrachium rosenbergii TaxID=79674 RepID=UPI0034D41207